jgi:hypothetical protein
MAHKHMIILHESMAKMNQTEYGRMHPDLAHDVIMSSKMQTTDVPKEKKVTKPPNIIPNQTFGHPDDAKKTP